MTTPTSAEPHAGEIHQHGQLRLVAAVDGDARTRLVRRAHRFPLRVTVPFHLDPLDAGMAFVYVQNPTGAVAAGDDLRTHLTAEAGARVHLTTQAATKLARMDDGHAEETVDLDVGAGAYVEHLPDLLIPQAGAAHTQSVRVRLADGAAYVGGDLLAPGRATAGERFAYRRLRLSTHITWPDGAATDALELCPEAPGAAPSGLGEWSYVASVLAVGHRADGDALAERMDTAVAGDSVWAAASTLPGGCGALARVLGTDRAAVAGARERGWVAARGMLRGLGSVRVRK